jgi:hypothetical protein
MSALGIYAEPLSGYIEKARVWLPATSIALTPRLEHGGIGRLTASASDGSSRIHAIFYKPNKSKT